MSSVSNCTTLKDKPNKRSYFQQKAMSYKLQHYIVALRPWSFTASITPVALGSMLAYKTHEEFSILVFILVCICALCVHAAGNLVNTYFDFIRGIDTKHSDDRTLVDSILKPDDVASLGGFFYILGCIGFFLLSTVSPARMEHLALLYFGGLSSSFLYTGGLGLKYIALGDILIFITFGPLTVAFAFLSQTGALSLVPMMYALPIALNTEAILHSNNTRDMVTDNKAGIVTLAIILGKTGSYILFIVLVFTPYIIFSLMGVHFSLWMFLPTLSIFYAFKQDKLFRRGHHAKIPQSLAFLNLVMGVLYIIACMLSPKYAFRTLM